VAQARDQRQERAVHVHFEPTRLQAALLAEASDTVLPLRRHALVSRAGEAEGVRDRTEDQRRRVGWTG
jgi:hypothetical protein